MLRALWFALIPLILSLLGLRYLVPHSTSASGLEGAFSDLARAHTSWVVVAPSPRNDMVPEM